MYKVSFGVSARKSSFNTCMVTKKVNKTLDWHAALALIKFNTQGRTSYINCSEKRPNNCGWMPMKRKEVTLDSLQTSKILITAPKYFTFKSFDRYCQVTRIRTITWRLLADANSKSKSWQACVLKWKLYNSHCYSKGEGALTWNLIHRYVFSRDTLQEDWCLLSSCPWLIGIVWCCVFLIFLIESEALADHAYHGSLWPWCA